MPLEADHVESVFAAAVALGDPAARAAYLDGVAARDPGLRERVGRLLAAHDAAGSFLRPADGTIDDPTTAEIPGATVGPYRLMEQIGEGGMGLVFVAEQERPVRRRVALKLIKPGMDSRDVIARFEAERQALALMDHPNIAKVLDAGTTDSGRPFFVMELVRGVPITDYCDQAKLTPRERLELFVDVCRAVQHAHTKGVIHRDLKPSNVLVTLHDGRPVVKVIDFGVAKAVGQRLTDKTVYTRFTQMIGTPLYMSPEQAEMSGLDVDTRSDVYSLGVLLYELLTGTTPFDRERLVTAAFDEIRRIIREEDPPRPSARLSGLKATLPAVSANRRTEPARLPALVRGELDWIVMKALEKDRTRRYETANGLAHDVERYLKDEPVEACPPSLGYRTKKWVKRHLGAVAISFIIGMMGINALGFSTLQWLLAEDARKEAVASEDRARANAQEAARERDEVARQFQRAHAAETATADALRRSEGLRLATTALLRKPQNHDVAMALAHEAVTLSDDPATLGTALAAVQGMPKPRPLPLPFYPSGWFTFLPDGRHLITVGSSERKALVFDTATRTPAREFSIQPEGDVGLENLVADPRGRWLVGLDDGGGLTVWDVSDGRTLGRHRLDGFTLGAATFAAEADTFSVIAKKPAAKDGDREPVSHRLVVFTMPAFEVAMEFETTDPLRAVAVSRDGRRVATSSVGNRVLRVWDAATKALLLEEREADTLPFPSLAFSRDGSKLLDVTRDGVAAWDIAGRTKTLLRDGSGQLTANGATVRASADGAVLLVQPSTTTATLHSKHFLGSPGPLRVFDAERVRWVRRLDAPANEVATRAQLSADGRRVVARTGNGTVVAWDLTDGRTIFRAAKPDAGDGDLAIDPAGAAAVTTGVSQQLYLWDLGDRGVLPEWSTGRSNEHALVDGRGATVTVFRGDGRVEVLDATTLRTLDLGSGQQFPWQLDGRTVVRVLADGRRLLRTEIATGNAVLTAHTGEEVARYESLPNSDPAFVRRQRLLTSRDTGRRFLLAARRPGSQAAGASSDDEVVFRVLDADSGRVVATLDLGPGTVGVKGYALSADGRRAALIPSRRRDRRAESVEVWNLDAGTVEGTVEAARSGEPRAMAFGRAGSQLIVCAHGQVGLWDVASRKHLRQLDLTAEPIRQVALSRNGRLIATDTTTEFGLWDAQTGHNLYRCPHTSPFCEGLTFVADDTMVLVDLVRFTLTLMPADVPAHFRRQGLRTLTDIERKAFSVATRGPSP